MLPDLPELLRKFKVEQLLEAAGAKSGDSITIGYKEFDFYPDYYPSDFDDMPIEELKRFQQKKNQNKLIYQLCNLITGEISLWQAH